jgi:hypothetical protein
MIQRFPTLGHLISASASVWSLLVNLDRNRIREQNYIINVTADTKGSFTFVVESPKNNDISIYSKMG